MAGSAVPLSSTPPPLGATDHVPPSRKRIHRIYRHVRRRSFWLIAELDAARGIAYGYANLNHDETAAWGYLMLDELVELGAVRVDLPAPVPFPEAVESELETLDWLVGHVHQQGRRQQRHRTARTAPVTQAHTPIRSSIP